MSACLSISSYLCIRIICLKINNTLKNRSLCKKISRPSICLVDQVFNSFFASRKKSKTEHNFRVSNITTVAKYIMIYLFYKHIVDKWTSKLLNFLYISECMDKRCKIIEMKMKQFCTWCNTIAKSTQVQWLPISSVRNSGNSKDLISDSNQQPLYS